MLCAILHGSVCTAAEAEQIKEISLICGDYDRQLILPQWQHKWTYGASWREHFTRINLETVLSVSPVVSEKGSGGWQ